jgi:hypothetical protein
MKAIQRTKGSVLVSCLMAAVATLCLAGTANAVPVIIHFDALSNMTVVTNQYAGLGVTFSSTGGFVNYVTTQAQYNGTPPNFLCTGPVGGGINCSAETILDFSTPVSGLTFQALGVNDVSSDVAHIDIFQNGVFGATFVVPGAAQSLNPLLIDFSSFNDITKIRIYAISDGGGIGWDTFTYDQEAPAVPEPASLLLLGTGLVGLVGAARRRLRK